MRHDCCFRFAAGELALIAVCFALAHYPGVALVLVAISVPDFILGHIRRRPPNQYFDARLEVRSVSQPRPVESDEDLFHLFNGKSWKNDDFDGKA